MLFGFASQAPRQDRAETPFYADHLLPALQSTLATPRRGIRMNGYEVGAGS